ncbi:MAG: hypothetical protein QXL98_03105 [Thermofilaceae archaeon]
MPTAGQPSTSRVIIAVIALIAIATVFNAWLYYAAGGARPRETETVTATETTTIFETSTVTTTVTWTSVFFVGYPEYYSRYGGWLGLRSGATGFFRVEEINGTYWFIDPEGYVFISKGVNHVDYMGDYSPALGYSPYYVNVLRRYGSVDKWVEVTVSRLLRWGFNTVGAWSSRELFKHIPYTVNLNVLGDYGFDWQTGRMPDVFSDSFVEYANTKAFFNCAPLSNDSLLLGYFLDNEPRWGPDWRSPNHLLDDFIKMPSTSPGKRVAVEVIREAYEGDLSRLNSEMGTSFTSFDELLNYTGTLPTTPTMYQARVEFVKRYAERYFSVATQAVRRHDPNHLILGVRVAGLPDTEYKREVFKIMSKYVDVITVNIYNYASPPTLALAELFQLTGKPIIVTEFSYRAMDSGLPNTRGAGLTVSTQSERANLTYSFVTGLIKLPYVIGYHWFQYFDQPKEGRFDGENSNYGLVKIDDEPYQEMVEMFARLNTRVEKIRLGIETP